MLKVPVEVSARHVHLSSKAIEEIFGVGYKLSVKRELSQPGQFLSEEKVDIIAGERVLSGVSVLGPAREKTQIEISMTDARKLKINPCVRESGDISGSPGCVLRGSVNKTQIQVKEGVIVAKRHIHMNVGDAAKAEVFNGQICSLRIETKNRSLIFCDVVIRVSDSYRLAAHIDTDEANAAGITENIYGILETIAPRV
jgi:putative phosphotransacetylase